VKELRSRISTKGHATIPVEVRRLLGVGPHDENGFVIDAGEVRLTRAGNVVRVPPERLGATGLLWLPRSCGKLRSARWPRR
jgi:bifunctional DNA-binding transcriptional regulator/antitoxin component of YhaV-PrlF toxin-antitoxin module